MKLLTFIIFLLLFNSSYCQFKTTSEIGKDFIGLGSDYYTFTDNCFWSHAGYGLARVNNEGTSFYQFDAESFGNISKYSISRDSVNVYDDRNFFDLLQTNNNDVWLISDANERHLLQIRNDIIYNYTINNDSSLTFISYFCEDDGTTWFHFATEAEPIFNHLIYCYKKDSVQLKYSFSTLLSGFYKSYFFKLKDKYLFAEEEYIQEKYYFTIFEICNGNKEIFYRFDDNESDYGFNSSSHYIYNNELFILKSSGALLKIDEENNVKYYDIKIKKSYPQYNFLIVGNEFIYPTYNHLNKINLINYQEKQSDYLSISDKCKSVIKDIYFSRDRYIYCSLICNEEKDNSYIVTPECLAGNNLRIVSVDF